MFQVEAVMEIAATKEKMWAIWTDVENWGQWISSIKSAKLLYDFKNGTKGSLEYPNGQKFPFTIADCIENDSFICRSKLPLCTMDAGHEMKEENGKLKVRLYSKAYGPSLFIFKNAIRKESKGIEIALKKLAELAAK